MFIQGNLQEVFDALYTMGIIDPTLKTDWTMAEKEKKVHSSRLREMIQIINNIYSCSTALNSVCLSPTASHQKVPSPLNPETDRVKLLMESLKDFNRESLVYLAMEVARELVEFEERKTIH